MVMLGVVPSTVWVVVTSVVKRRLQKFSVHVIAVLLAYHTKIIWGEKAFSLNMFFRHVQHLHPRELTMGPVAHTLSQATVCQPVFPLCGDWEACKNQKYLLVLTHFTFAHFLLWSKDLNFFVQRLLRHLAMRYLCCLFAPAVACCVTV